MEISPKGPFPDIMTFWSGLNISHLESMTPRSIVAALENGKMQIQGELLSIDEKIALAEFLAKRTYSKSTIERNRCNAPEQILSEVKYFGWGGNLAGTGFIDNSIAKLPKNEVGGLKLKWAFGIEGGTNSRIKPTVINDKIIFGSQFGEVYCTDMVSGCTVWSFDADANIRGGIAVSDDIERGKSIFCGFHWQHLCLEGQ
jgi:polyvinyl alcohol dehydrogenase (cytochrome)